MSDGAITVYDRFLQLPKNDTGGLGSLIQYHIRNCHIQNSQIAMQLGRSKTVASKDEIITEGFGSVVNSKGQQFCSRPESVEDRHHVWLSSVVLKCSVLLWLQPQTSFDSASAGELTSWLPIEI